jgi:hypothetical protein
LVNCQRSTASGALLLGELEQALGVGRLETELAAHGRLDVLALVVAELLVGVGELEQEGAGGEPDVLSRGWGSALRAGSSRSRRTS